MDKIQVTPLLTIEDSQDACEPMIAIQRLQKGKPAAVQNEDIVYIVLSYFGMSYNEIRYQIDLGKGQLPDQANPNITL